MVKTYSLVVLSLASIFNHSVFAEEEKKLNLSGLIEVEAGFTNPSHQKSASEITLATVELGIDHTISYKVDSHLLFLFEEGENNNNIAVDEAIITLQPTKNIELAVGRMYVPFGYFESQMISDPLTLEIGETQEEAIQLAFSSGKVSSSVYLFKDDEDTSNKIDDFGLNINYKTDIFNAGVSYISDVNNKSDTHYSAKGLGIHAMRRFGQASLIAEHIKINKIAGNAKPSATNIEVGFDLGSERTLAVSVQKTTESARLDLPEKAVAIAYHMPVYKNTGFAAEYAKQERYNDASHHIVTLQLSYEF